MCVLALTLLKILREIMLNVEVVWIRNARWFWV